MDIVIYSLMFFALTCIGSFIGVCFERIPEGESIIKGRSHCESCGKTLKGYELVPIISYLFLRGRCSKCKKKIPLRCLGIEFFTAVFGIIPLIMYGVSVQGFAYCAISCILFEIALLDYRTMEISDFASLLIGLIGIAMMIYQGSYLSSLIGAVCVSIPFLVFALCGVMGYGDVKLMAAVGVLLGIKGVLFAAFAGIVIGCFAAIILKFKKTHDWKSEIAFGPYLCIGSYLSMLIGPTCVDLYLSILK